MKHWTITNAAGAMLGQLILADGTHPSDIKNSGWAWEDGQVAIEQVAQADPAVKTFNGTAWAEDMAKLDGILSQRIDDARETHQLAVITGGEAKAVVYSAKAQEAQDYRNLTAAALAALSAVQRRARFPFAMAEADLTGDALLAVIVRFEAGAITARRELARIEALAQRAKRLVAAAKTRAEKEAAASVSWGV